MRRIIIFTIIICNYFLGEKSISRTSIGQIGKVYPIIEKDFAEVMEKKAKLFISSPKYTELQKKYHEHSVNYVKRPKGATLPRAKKYSIRSYTPSFTVENDIVDADGKILYKKGTSVNALKFKSLTKALCFFDGDDKQQAEWIMINCGNNPLNKLILVQGEYLKISKKYNKRLYFDQRSYLVEKLQIKALPTVVRQKGMNLYVEEYAL